MGTFPCGGTLMKLLRYALLILIAVHLDVERLFPCTMIAAVKDSLVLAGNNEDYNDPDTFIWFTQKNEIRKYGCIYFGYGNFRPQGGMNEAGLCFDGFGTVTNKVKDSKGRPIFDFYPDFASPMDQIMSNCSSVEDVVELMEHHDLSFMKSFQLMFADKRGYFVIVEGDEIIWKTTYYLVCTNFYHSNPSLGGYPCWRYETAVDMLEEHKDSISVPLFKDILNATHQEGQYPTLYSNIYDLNKGLVYLHYNHNYDEVIKIDLQKESKGLYKKYHIPSQFSNLNLHSPENGSIIGSNSVTFTWEGEARNYQFCYSNDPEFSDYEMIDIDMSNFKKNALIPFGIFFFIPFIFVKRVTKIRKFFNSTTFRIHEFTSLRGTGGMSETYSCVFVTKTSSNLSS